MNSANRRNEGTPQQYSNETNQHNALHHDPPPSYYDAMRNSPYPATYDPARPTAPYPTENDPSRLAVPPYPIQNDSTGQVAPPYSASNAPYHGAYSGPAPISNDYKQPPSAPGFEAVNGANITYASLQNDERYRQWNDEATRILMTRRLEMEEQFRKAQNRRDNELLWMMILTDLNSHGYHYSLLDMIWFWQMQSHLYQSIVHSAHGYDSSWQYYQPMHNVYGGGSSTTDLLSSTTVPGSSVIPSTSVVPDSSSVPSTTILPSPLTSGQSVLPEGNSNNITTSVLPSNVPNSASNLPSDASTAVISGNDVPSMGLSSDPSTITNSDLSSVPGPSPNLLPPIDSGNNLPLSSEASNLITNVSSSEQVPLLTNNDGSNILNSVQGLNINPVTESSLATDAVASAIPNIAPESITLTESANLASIGNVITTQPSEGLSIPKVLDDNIITSQPTFSPGIYSGATATTMPSNDDNDCCDCDECCGCGDDDCCGDDGGCCCGDDGDCCDGCSGDCGDCGDCDGLDL